MDAKERGQILDQIEYDLAAGEAARNELSQIRAMIIVNFCANKSLPFKIQDDKEKSTLTLTLRGGRLWTR
jgi:hypothetical protein